MRQVFAGLVAAGAFGFAASGAAFDSNIPASGLPTAPQFSASLLPEQEGIVSWKTLAKVEPVKRDGRMVPEFAKEILGLDQHQVRIQGFILPMDLGDKQRALPDFGGAAALSVLPACRPGRRGRGLRQETG